MSLVIPSGNTALSLSQGCRNSLEESSKKLLYSNTLESSIKPGQKRQSYRHSNASSNFSFKLQERDVSLASHHDKKASSLRHAKNEQTELLKYFFGLAPVKQQNYKDDKDTESDHSEDFQDPGSIKKRCSVGKVLKEKFERSKILSTLKEYRWTVQSFFITLIGSFFVLIHPVDVYAFHGSGYYVVFSGLAVLESTNGACFRKSLGRFFGTLSGGVLGWVLFIGLTAYERFVTAVWFPYVLFVVGLLLTIPWGILRQKQPFLNYFCQYGLATALMVCHSGFYHGGDTLALAACRTGAVALGVLVNGLVVQYILPNPARPRLVGGLSKILRCLSDLLAPAVGFSSGYLNEYAETFSASEATILRNNSLYRNKRECFNKQVISVIEAREIIRKAKWKKVLDGLQHCHKLLLSEKELTDAAVNEIKLKHPRRINRAKTVAAYKEVRQLFFHVASLVYSVEVQFASQRVPELLMSHFSEQVASSTVMDNDCYGATAITFEHSNSHKSNIADFDNNERTLQQCGLPQSSAHRQHSVATTTGSCYNNQSIIDSEHLSSLPPLLHEYFAHATSNNAIIAGVDLLHLWGEIYGVLQQRAITDISKALETMAQFIDAPSESYRILASRAISSAQQSITMLPSRGRKSTIQTECYFCHGTTNKCEGQNYHYHKDSELFEIASIEHLDLVTGVKNKLTADEEASLVRFHLALRNQLCYINQTLSALSYQMDRCFSTLVELGLKSPSFVSKV